MLQLFAREERASAAKSRERGPSLCVHGGSARSMGFSLADIFVAGLLVVNGAAILNEDRFLAKVGWGYEASRSSPASVKKQIINLLHAMRLLFTIPLMAVNVIVIVLKLLLG